MKFLRLSLVAVVAVAAAWGARAAESPVTITPELKGAWVKPDKGWDGRTVLLLHGFASDMDDAGGLFKRLAQALAARGIASLRINFRGEGDSKRTNIASTFATRLEDTAAAYAWLVEQRGVNGGRVGVLGFSLGASTAIETGAQYPDWFKSMALWSSPSGDQFEAMTGGFKTAFDEARRTGSGSEELAGWKTVTLRKEFFDSFRGVDLDKSLAKYPGAFLTVRGTQDMLPQHDDVFLKIAPGEPKEKLIIEGADHIYHVFDGEKGQSAQVIDATVAWFLRTL
jgi:pimeloyl-ACP methyl ester carboxylesterase